MIWTSFANMWLGLWLLSAPFVFNLSGTLLTSDLCSGALLICVGALTRRGNRQWVSWVGGLCGVWLQLAPLAFWAKDAACYLNDTLCGALAIAFCILIPRLGPTDEGPAIPPGWSYNPSSWPQRIPIALLATIGWFISRYMAAYQLGYIDQVWDPFFPDGTLHVITSDVSKAFPVSDAGLGAMAYSLEALLACKGVERRWRLMPWMVVLLGLLVVPLSLISILLIILQPTIVGAWCSLCLFTAFCMLILVLLGIDEIAAVLQYLRAPSDLGFWRRFFMGGPSQGAKEDLRTPSLSAPMSQLAACAFWGVSFRFSLLLSALLGILLMPLPSILGMGKEMSTADHILGPFVAVASIVAMADVARRARFFTIAFAVLIAAASILTQDELMIHLGGSVVLIGLSWRGK